MATGLGRHEDDGEAVLTRQNEAECGLRPVLVVVSGDGARRWWRAWPTEETGCSRTTRRRQWGTEVGVKGVEELLSCVLADAS